MDSNVPVAISFDNEQVRDVVRIIIEDQGLAGQLDSLGPGAILVLEAHHVVDSVCMVAPQDSKQYKKNYGVSLNQSVK